MALATAVMMYGLNQPAEDERVIRLMVAYQGADVSSEQQGPWELTTDPVPNSSSVIQIQSAIRDYIQADAAGRGLTVANNDILFGGMALL